ncbi:hypothetical protein UCRPC4_g06601 [Phaeomoniella chlamydospora]|uniref:Uncharacterized protein n=1 Tax=Phaeomoniella chlamydospora TaxID=158046 RepID=A0A0G2FSL0_PHACM|nr:hypothetical protein UCRPC4_g06601 [Phaeomoniella chlamydospora]
MKYYGSDGAGSDHFDQTVEESLRRDLPIITTPHAKEHLTGKGAESFTQVFDLDFFQEMIVNIGSQTRESRRPQIKVTGTPGKHVGDGVIGTANDYLQAVPPTNGWLVELGYNSGSGEPDAEAFGCGYRIYISGDTLMVDDLKSIPEHCKGKNVDLMLIHLGGTTIPSPSLPLLMVTMDAKQGIELVKLIKPDLTIPIHYDDYDVFLSPLEDFKTEMTKAGLDDKVIYLDRGDTFKFRVQT